MSVTRGIQKIGPSHGWVAVTTHGLQKSGATHGAPCECPTLLYGAGAGHSRPMGYQRVGQLIKVEGALFAVQVKGPGGARARPGP